VWGQRQWTLPHNHHHRAIIGMYGGGEDNIFWRRLPEDEKGRVEAAGAASLRQGDVTVLGRDIIHSVTNPLDRVSYAIHVYDGDSSPLQEKAAGMPRPFAKCLTTPAWCPPPSVKRLRAGKDARRRVTLSLGNTCRRCTP